MIEKIAIPDDDVPGWMQTLRGGGFTDEEIDSILAGLNRTYASIKQENFIARELSKMEAEIARRRGSQLSEREKTELRAGIESRFRDLK